MWEKKWKKKLEKILAIIYSIFQTEGWLPKGRKKLKEDDILSELIPNFTTNIISFCSMARMRIGAIKHEKIKPEMTLLQLANLFLQGETC